MCRSSTYVHAHTHCTHTRTHTHYTHSLCRSHTVHTIHALTQTLTPLPHTRRYTHNTHNPCTYSPALTTPSHVNPNIALALISQIRHCLLLSTNLKDSKPPVERDPPAQVSALDHPQRQYRCLTCTHSVIAFTSKTQYQYAAYSANDVDIKTSITHRVNQAVSTWSDYAAQVPAPWRPPHRCCCLIQRQCSTIRAKANHTSTHPPV